LIFKLGMLMIPLLQIKDSKFIYACGEFLR
jgi:hypothetical protein